MNYKKVLVLAVGGGNDSVSTLLLQKQLNKTFNYNPEQIDIVAVLPDCLEYQNMDSTKHHLINKITENSTRSVNDKIINAFPERILVQNKNVIKELNVENIFGISMLEGSKGVFLALQHMIDNNGYDLVLSIDVGGDFIACKENIEVLSPMMDGYMLYSLKKLEEHIKVKNKKIEMLYCVFGLGTDGESSPKMLDKALSLIPDVKEYNFVKNDVEDFIDFYRNIVEPNRYSRTTDYTILEICNIKENNSAKFRGRFHVLTENNKSNVHYGNFEHKQDDKFYGKYYLFKNISQVNNLYSEGVNNGIEWFLNVQKTATKINHELNGQTYNNLELLSNDPKLVNTSLFFGTPSRKFNKEQQTLIIKEINQAILDSLYDLAYVYNDQIEHISKELYICNINDDISLIALNKHKLNMFLNNFHNNS